MANLSRKTPIWTIRLSLAVFSTLSLNCSEGPVCKELGNCGGDPVDRWAQVPRGAETPGTYCQEIMHVPPIEEPLRDQLFPVARQRLPEKANADWCSDLITTNDMSGAVRKHSYWWENLPYITGILEYEPDGTYRAHMTRKGFVDRWYSDTCIHKYGYAGD